MKVAVVVGARPNFVKHAILSPELRKKHQEIIIHTGQHYDSGLDKVFFEQLEIPKPNYQLGVGSGTHAEQTGEAMIRAEKVLLKEKPDWVVVYGDTNSTLAAALAAAKLNIAVAHVEAGLRSYNKNMPEEVNRVIVDHISTLLFAPTESAVSNLKKENLVEGVYNTGDVMYDAVLKYEKVAAKKSDILQRLKFNNQKFFIATIHRAETVDNPVRLCSVIEAFKKIKIPVIFPVHPRTREALKNMPLEKNNHHLKFIEPVSYLDMISLVKNAGLVITDSGGLQKEAYFLKTPCITCMDEDNWPETTAAKANLLVGTSTHKILEAITRPFPIIKDADEFGDGQAAQKIASLLSSKPAKYRPVAKTI